MHCLPIVPVLLHLGSKVFISKNNTATVCVRDIRCNHTDSAPVSRMLCLRSASSSITELVSNQVWKNRNQEAKINFYLPVVISSSSTPLESHLQRCCAFLLCKNNKKKSKSFLKQGPPRAPCRAIPGFKP